MAFGQSTVSAIGGAVSDIFSSQATAGGLKIKAQGERVEAGNYRLAADLAGRNEQFTEQSTAVKEAMAQRQIFQGIGTEQAAIAASGFAESGSALDLLRSSAQQGSLQKQLIGQQGLITEAGYKEQAQSYTNLSTYAEWAATQEDKLASQSGISGFLSAGIKLVGAGISLIP